MTLYVWHVAAMTCYTDTERTLFWTVHIMSATAVEHIVVVGLESALSHLWRSLHSSESLQVFFQVLCGELLYSHCYFCTQWNCACQTSTCHGSIYTKLQWLDCSVYFMPPSGRIKLVPLQCCHFLCFLAYLCLQRPRGCLYILPARSTKVL